MKFEQTLKCSIFAAYRPLCRAQGVPAGKKAFKKDIMARFLLLGLILLFASLAAEAQKNVFVEEDPPIGKMMDRFAEANQAREYVDGWRVQILATPDRQRLESVKQSFQYRYPSVPVDWVHSAPYYKLRAGAFASKLEALRLKYILEQDYPGIYLVRDDNIRPRELIGNY